MTSTATAYKLRSYNAERYERDMAIVKDVETRREALVESGKRVIAAEAIASQLPYLPMGTDFAAKLREINELTENLATLPVNPTDIDYALGIIRDHVNAKTPLGIIEVAKAALMLRVDYVRKGFLNDDGTANDEAPAYDYLRKMTKLWESREQ